MLFSDNRLSIVSPIKWAGGKKFILDKLWTLMEVHNDKKCFVENFCGSCAVTLHYQPRKVILNDSNYPLMNMWRMIKDYPNELCNELKRLSNNELYNNVGAFNLIRNEFNELKRRVELSMEERILMGAYFIYLNKRSFNGLYRENKSGIYNVPFRMYKSGEIYSETNIRNISKYFNENEVYLRSDDYLKVEIPRDSLVYIDPPYYRCGTSDFTSYTKEGFGRNEQDRLVKYCDDLNKRKVKFIESNSPCEEIFGMYEKYNMESFFTRRFMRSAKQDQEEKEEEENELLIWN